VFSSERDPLIVISPPLWPALFHDALRSKCPLVPRRFASDRPRLYGIMVCPSLHVAIIYSETIGGKGFVRNRMSRVECQARNTAVSMPTVKVRISRTEKANSVCIGPQYTTVTQVPPRNRLGRAVLSREVANTQKIHVTNTQMACAPMDAIGCLYQSGCRKKAVYSPAVTAVQQAENKTNRAPFLVVKFGELLWWWY